MPLLNQLFDMVGGSNKGAYFLAFGGIACWRVERCLHLLSISAFG